MSTPSAPITTRPKLIKFTSDYVQPPAARYITKQDELLIYSMGSSAALPVYIRVRLLRPNGDVALYNIRHDPYTSRLAKYQRVILDEGCLLSVTAAGGLSSQKQGECWVEVSLTHGDPSQYVQTIQLLQGYVAYENKLTWPHGRMFLKDEGIGNVYGFFGTNPAAGSEISETVPTNAQWRLRSIYFSLVTSAAAANRRVSITFFFSGGFVFLRTMDAEVVAASSGVSIVVAPLGHVASVVGGLHLVPIPQDIILREGWGFETLTVGLQAGDNFSAPVVMVEEFLTF